MTFDEIAEALASAEMPLTYYSWPDKAAPALPYVCYYYPQMNPETADDTHHAQIYQLNIELYTKNKQFDAEQNLETILLDAGLVFEKEETYLNDEHMYEVLYITEVNING